MRVEYSREFDNLERSRDVEPGASDALVKFYLLSTSSRTVISDVGCLLLNDMNTLKTIIALIFLPSSILVGIVFLLRKFFEQTLSRDIERFKFNLQSELEQSKLRLENELQTKNFEFQTKFTSYHQKQADVIGELYGMLNETEWEVEELVHPLRPGGESVNGERVHETECKCIELSRFFSKNRIYLDNDLCEKMDTIIKVLRKAITTFDFSHMSLNGKPSLDIWMEAWNVLVKELPPIKRAIESQFRESLSIVPDAPRNPVNAQHR